jgi:hypothetical protein
MTLVVTYNSGLMSFLAADTTTIGETSVINKTYMVKYTYTAQPNFRKFQMFDEEE